MLFYFLKVFKESKLLNWHDLDIDCVRTVGHVDAMKWIESNGIDVVNNERHFRKFACHASYEVIEYLLSDRGLEVGALWKSRLLDCTFLKIVYRTRGWEELQKVDIKRIVFDFDTVRFLRSVAYKFEKSYFLKSNLRPSSHYSLICGNVLKYSDLSEKQKSFWEIYVELYDLRACKQMYPFMKEIRRKKIMTVILCICKTCGLQKEIIWNILDLAYSPINQRGPL